MKSKFLIKIAFILAIISMFSSFSKTGEAFVLSKETNPATTIIYGDANNDGKITAADARIVLLISASLRTDVDLNVCDVNNDSKITATDARHILRASASLENLNCIRFGHNVANGICSYCGYTEKITSTTPVSTTKIPETTTAPVTTTKKQDSSTSVSDNVLVNEIFKEINSYRASLGLYPLKFNAELSDITIVRAKEASVYWSHTRPDGRDFWTVFTDANKFNNIAVGEILAKIGSGDAKRAVNGWINSPSHNAVLTTTKYTEIGIAYYVYDGHWYVAAHTI